MPPPSEIARTPRAMLPAGQTYAPTFYLTGRQTLSPGAILLAILAAALSLGAILYALSHTRAHLLPGGPDSSQSSGTGDDDKDDPNQVDTIVLGDPTDAPRPAHRGEHVSPVHPTLLVILPSSGGEHFGQIPDNPAGHLLYDWLAAFNHADPTALARVLPTIASGATTDAQMEIRRQTGGFALVSAKEVQPGLLVFRLRDQTPASTEVLGTLWMRPDSSPPAIENFSLRAVPPPAPAAPSQKEPTPSHPGATSGG